MVSIQADIDAVGREKDRLVRRIDELHVREADLRAQLAAEAQQGRPRTLLYAAAGLTPQSAEPFRFQSEYLDYIGMTEAGEQYALYCAVGIAAALSVQPMRKAYYLKKYILATNPSIKELLARRGNFSDTDRAIPHLTLHDYQWTPVFWAYMPFSVIMAHFTRETLK